VLHKSSERSKGKNNSDKLGKTSTRLMREIKEATKVIIVMGYMEI
jgi:hypothetical protein